MNNFQRGELCPVAFAPYTAGNLGTFVTLQITGYHADSTVKLADVTHTGLNGAGTGRLACKPDFSATINADFDADLPPYESPPSLNAGTNGLILFALSAAGGTPANPNEEQDISMPVVIEKLHFQSQVGSQVKYSFDVKQNLLAPFVGAGGASGGTTAGAQQGLGADVQAPKR